MPANVTDFSATAPASDLLQGILNASLNGIIAYESVRSETGTLIDFRTVTVNHAARQILHLPDASPGWRLLTKFPSSRTNGTFVRYVRVVDTGEPDRFQVRSEAGGITVWFDVSAVKLDDGFVVTFNDITTQQETVQSLSERNSLLDSILESSSGGIFTLTAVRDATGRVRDFRFGMMNERAVLDITRNFGRNPIDRLLSAVNPDTHRTGQFSAFVRVVETGTPVRQEHRYAATGLWYQMVIVKIGDGIVVTATDVTAQKLAQQELGQQTDLMQTMLAGAINGVMLLEPIYDDQEGIVDFTILAANQAAERLTGLSTEKIIGQSMLATYPAYKEAGFFGVYRRAFLEQPDRMEGYYEDGSGLRGWFEVSAVRQGSTLVLTFAQTTDLRQAEQELKQAADELQAVIDNAQTGIFVFSPVRDDAGEVVNFRFKAINKTVAALIGETPDAIRGDLASDWFISYRDTETFARYKTTLATGEEQRFDTNYNVDGFDVWFDVRSVKLGDDVLVTFTDYTDLKRTQLAAQKLASEVASTASLLNSVLDSSENGIASLTAIRDDAGVITDFRFVTANEASERLLHVPVETMLGNTVKTLFPGNVESGLFAMYASTVTTGEPSSTEMHYALDGLDFWLVVSAKKLGDGFVVTFADMTERRRLALFAEQQASLLSSVLNGSINGIISFGAVRDQTGTITDFKFLTVNEAAGQMVKKTADEVVGKRLLSVFPGNVKSGLFDRYVHTTNTGEPTRTEVNYKLDGLDFWLDISAQKLGDGFVITFTDTSLIRRATRAIEQSAAELQTVIDTTNAGIFLIVPVWDETGGITDFRLRVANRVMADFAGQNPDAVVGGLGSVWFPDYMTNGLFDRYKTTYLTGQTQQFEMHHENGILDAWVSVLATKMGDQVLVTFSDFTELKKLQQQLEASVIDLQRSNKNLEQFAYVASHDLQEPLRKIQQFGDILQSGYAPVLDESGRDMLRRMQLAAERMRTLIKDVLAYSRITTKRESAKTIDLNTLLGDVTGDLETAVSEKNARISIDALPPVRGDAVQLRQLFQNLISNALKFTKPGRQPQLQLRYTVQRGRDTGLPVSAADETRQFYRLELSDNGIGFDPHQANKIFQVFQRLHNRNEYRGTGIGLAIVQKVVENHQGYVHAEGRPDEGATFTILLPV